MPAEQKIKQNPNSMASEEPPRKKRRCRRELNLEKATKEELVQAIRGVGKAFDHNAVSVDSVTRDMHKRGLCNYIKLYGCEMHFVGCYMCNSEDVDLMDDAIPVPGEDQIWVCHGCIDLAKKVIASMGE